MATAVKEKGGIKVLVKDPSRFGDRVARVAEACSTNATIPILTCMKIEVRAGNVIFTGGNGIVTTCIAERDVVTVEEETAIAVPAKLFSDIIQKLPTGQVELTIGEKSMRIQAGTAKFEIGLLDVAEYPPINLDKNAVSVFTIPASSLVAALRSTVYCSATSEIMPVLTGVCMEAKKGTNGLKFTATDKNRLSRALIEGVKANPFRAPIAAVSCKEIVRLFGGLDAELKVALTQSSISVTGQGVMLISQLLDGEFPDTDKLIPTAYQLEVSLECEKLLGALTRAKLLVQKQRMAIFTLKDDLLSIDSKTEVGQVKEDLPCQTLGKEMRLGLDVFYLIEALKSIDQKQVRFSFTSPVTPITIRPENDATKIISIVLPIRITGE
jgi:DNA polymerase-3 subunit beta